MPPRRRLGEQQGPGLVLADGEGYSDAEVLARLQLLRSRRDPDASLPPKPAEFDIFASGNATHRRSRGRAPSAKGIVPLRLQAL
jgi:hypothetical protein